MGKTRQSNKDIAIIGMAGRFPGAADIDRFWDNLCHEVESIDFFNDEDAIAAGVDPALVKHPDYVKAWGALDGIEHFDANFFGIPGREAEAMDPQHRLFLEVCASALNNAGYDPETYDGYIGCISGVGMSTYLLRHLIPNQDRLQTLGEFLVFLGNDKDFMPTRVSYKLNLRGPSHSVSTGCSTTLVATHLACRQLLSYQTDIALAGGANIKVPQKAGYLYRKGQLKSPDGRCRAFDAKARGTVFGNAVAAVALKRLNEALEDGDHIYAVIKGSAINNDGSSKAAFTAPSIQGQTEVIAEAHAIADLPFDTITYMEAHGTGTELGDPIEIKSLNTVFRQGDNGTDKKQYCAMASVKTNIGHVDNVAGVAGLIKTALCLERKQIPASLHFEEPNPEIDFANSPFYINTKLQDWRPPDGLPRRACLSAFGAGGTNAHAVLEEAPTREPSGPSRPLQLLTVSAKTPTALENYSKNLAAWLEARPELSFADAAYTMAVGRTDFAYRRCVVAANAAEAIQALRSGDPERTINGVGQAGAERVEEIRELAAGLDADEGSLGEKLIALGKLWANGGKVDWPSLFAGERRYRVPMPNYPFDKHRYWLDEPKRGVAMENLSVNLYKKPDLGDWFYAPSWKRTALAPRDPKSDGRCWVIFADSLDVGDSLARRLTEAGIEAVTVEAGDDFHKRNDRAYVIDYRDPNHYNGMLTDLHARHGGPKGFVHLWNLRGERPPLSLETAKAAQNLGFNSLVYLAQAIAFQSIEGDTPLLAVSNHLHRILDDDEIHPEKATLLGAVRVISQEHESIRCRSVELDRADEAGVDALWREMAATSTDQAVAYRHGYRWSETFEPVYVDGEAAPTIREGGIYLITGGLGGIGLELARALAGMAKVRLVLLGRSAFPQREKWDAWREEHGQAHPVSRKIEALRELEALGARIMTIQADAGSAARMAEIAERIETELGGPVNGVIHAAGVAEIGLIQRKKAGESDPALESKMECALVLRDLFGGTADFTFYCSSLAAVMGGYGQAGYSAGNSFLDALAQSAEAPRGAISVNWDAWRETGMAAGRQTEDLVRFGILSEEGRRVFQRSLSAGLPQTLISTRDFAARLRMLRDNQLFHNAEALAEKHAVDEATLYPRPEMSAPYEAPRNELEHAMAQLWQHMLGIEKIGVNDDFFELGGDSLKGMNLVNQLEKRLGETFHVEALFDTATVGELANYIQERYPGAAARMLGRQGEAEPVEGGEVTPEKMARLRALAPTLPPRRGEAGPKNKRALFVLAPPRSGTTLLRVMLGGHPELFAPPELFLLSFNAMDERKAAFPDAESFWLEGALLAVMRLRDCSLEEARAIVADFESRRAPVKAFYAQLQEWAGQRTLVDKTPSYAYDPATLQRAEADFDQPVYVHLTRHPYGMIHSYQEAKMDLLIRRRFDRDLPFTSREMAEMVWRLCHENVREFLEGVPASRHLQISFEALVSQPRETLQALCDKLDLAFDPDMLNPYQDKRGRMAEGVHEQSRMLGDMKFHQHAAVDPAAADRWRQVTKEDFLSRETLALAATFGYDPIGAGEPDAEALLAKVDQLPEGEVDALLRKMMSEQ